MILLLFLLQLLEKGDMLSSITVLSSFPLLPCHLLCTNLLHLLHLPTQIRAPSTYTCLSTAVLPKLTRIKNNDDLFDSEGDEDEKENIENVDVTKSESSPVKMKKSTIQKKSGALTKDDKLLGETMDALAELYDNISFGDSHLAKSNVIGARSVQNFDIGLGTVTTGQLDEFRMEDEKNYFSESADYVTLGNVHRCRGVINRVLGSCSDEVKEAMTVPVAEPIDKLQIDVETDTQRRLVFCFD